MTVSTVNQQAFRVLTQEGLNPTRVAAAMNAYETPRSN
jgi:hypothetical protein